MKGRRPHRKLSLEGEIPTGNWSSNTRPFYKRLPTLNLSIRIYKDQMAFSVPLGVSRA